MNQEYLLKIILAPHMSEKSSLAQQNNQYVFRVAKSASKPEIKAAIELIFEKNVTSVRIVNVKSKPKRFGQIQGRSKAWKKAYVELQPGQSIEFTGA